MASVIPFYTDEIVSGGLSCFYATMLDFNQIRTISTLAQSLASLSQVQDGEEIVCRSQVCIMLWWSVLVLE